MKQTKQGKFLKNIAGWVIPCVIGVLASWATNTFLFYLPHVSGESMADTFHDGDLLLCTRVYGQEGIQRYDVVTVNLDGKQIVKRVYGLPGETISADRNGRICVGGVPIDDPYGKEPMERLGTLEGGVVLSEGEYFLLGDNRNNSDDSRFSIGTVKFEDICGKVRFKASKR